MDISNIIIYIGVLVASISIHEMMHSVVAYWLGDDTARSNNRLTLNPLSHIDPFTTIALPLLLALANQPPIGAARPVPVDTRSLRGGDYGLAIVGVAGPLTNLVLAAVGAVLVRSIPALQTALGLDIMSIWINVNVAFFVFNMIPFPPLDGSRLLYAFAPEPVQAFMRQIESLGFMGILLFVIIGGPALSGLIGEVSDSIMRLFFA